MSFMIELLYHSPADTDKEVCLVRRIKKLGGSLDFREVRAPRGPLSICLTFEFTSFFLAKAAADQLRRGGEHVEGPREHAAN